VALVFFAHERARAADARPPMFAGVRRLPARYWRVVTFLVAFSLANFPDALLLLRLNDIGFGVAGVVFAYVGYNAVYALASYPAGLLADKFAPATIFAIGLVFFAIGYLGLGLTTDTALAWVLIAVYGVFTACYDGVGKAWISTLLPAELQSGGQGVFQGLSGFAILFAGLWAGFLWGAAGRLPLLVSGGVGAVFAVGLLLFVAREN
jgi:MFS family permease